MFLGALVANIAIVVTGGAVRLTASGLGCPTVPTLHRRQPGRDPRDGRARVIEFGNRMLTFVLSAVVVAAVVVPPGGRAAATCVPPPRPVRSASSPRRVLGGVTVLTGLNPVTVMAHFLVSIGADRGRHRAYELSAGQPVGHQRLVARRASLLGGAALLVGHRPAARSLGTVVTGTGPHSGDKDATDRLPLRPGRVTQLHADLVFLLVGLTLGLARRAARAPTRRRRCAGAWACCSVSCSPRAWSASCSTSPTCPCPGRGARAGCLPGLGRGAATGACDDGARSTRTRVAHRAAEELVTHRRPSLTSRPSRSQSRHRRR